MKIYKRNEFRGRELANMIVLKNASILHANGKQAKNHDIFIEDGKIIKIDSTNQSKEPSYNKGMKWEIIDCTHLWITPGLVNMHTHAAMNILKGIAEDVSSKRWFNEIIWPYESKICSKDVYFGTLLAIAEMVDYGVTTFSDHYFFEEAVYQAVRECGIRAVIAPTIFGSAPSFEERLDQTVSFIRENSDKDSRIKFLLGPHAPYTCPGETLKKIIDKSKELNIGIHLHVSENIPQVEQCIRENGKTPFGVISRAGGLEGPCVIAHGSYIQDEDLRYLKEDTWFATCPKTYMKLASGVGNLYRLRNHIKYSFGSDGAASSNTLNPLEQARLFAMIGKNYFHNCEEYKNLEIWQALMRGHQAFGFQSGQIKEGWNADLVIWDLERVNTYPVYDPIASILYSADSTNVRYTMVDGSFLKKDGAVIFRTDSWMDEVLQLKEAILKRGKGNADIIY